MRVIVVTGPGGSDKSTLARELRRAGHYAVSTDGDVRLCSWATVDGELAVRPGDPDPESFAGHRWTWDPARLGEIIAEASEARASTCGYAATRPTSMT